MARVKENLRIFPLGLRKGFLIAHQTRPNHHHVEWGSKTVNKYISDTR
jgi:hypothetical protein